MQGGGGVGGGRHPSYPWIKQSEPPNREGIEILHVRGNRKKSKSSKKQSDLICAVQCWGAMGVWYGVARCDEVRRSTGCCCGRPELQRGGVR